MCHFNLIILPAAHPGNIWQMQLKQKQRSSRHTKEIFSTLTFNHLLTCSAGILSLSQAS